MTDIESLAIHGGTPVTDPQEARFIWPRLTENSKQAVLRQMDETISIYDNSGIFGEFEAAFAAYHARAHGLLFNSGTSAILAMYEAIRLQPGDEVLCPVYTFHATVSPLMYLGAIPIFCDADAEGNISFEQIVERRSTRTRAVVVTHMWGLPAADTAKIADYCRDNGLYLLEDCSHAHGARRNHSLVGTFGDLAAWSLQGQKTVTGGEGGILVTDRDDLYNRALLHGHYNKRPKTEIDHNDPSRDFYLTGMGLKLRAHPLAIALAADQFRHLDEFLAQRAEFARMLDDAVADISFLTPTHHDSHNITASWYAYNLLYNPVRARGVTREKFVEALHAEGLCEVDIPGSTGLLHQLPLFTRPHELLTRLYQAPLPSQSGYPTAENICRSIIKLPVWTFPDEAPIVNHYVRGIRRVATHIQRQGSL